MKVLVEGEVVEAHKNEAGDFNMYVVRLDTGFGAQTLPVAKSMTIDVKENMAKMLAMRDALLSAEHALITTNGLIAKENRGDHEDFEFDMEHDVQIRAIDAALKKAGFRK